MGTKNSFIKASESGTLNERELKKACVYILKGLAEAGYSKREQYGVTMAFELFTGKYVRENYGHAATDEKILVKEITAFFKGQSIANKSMMWGLAQVLINEGEEGVNKSHWESVLSM